MEQRNNYLVNLNEEQNKYGRKIVIDNDLDYFKNQKITFNSLQFINYLKVFLQKSLALLMEIGCYLII